MTDRGQYQHLVDESSSDPGAVNDGTRGASESFILDDGFHLRLKRRRSWLYRGISSPIWFFCFTVLAMVMILQALGLPGVITVLSSKNGESGEPSFSYERGFENDFEEMKSAINLIPQRFNGAVRSGSNGTLNFHWSHSSNERRYTLSSGATWDEVDESWETLLAGRYVKLQPSEISSLDADVLSPPLQSIVGPNTPPGIYGGPDMLHSLHCLDGLRKNLDLDRYEKHMWMNASLRRLHNDHCIEQLRQAILCHGDMTPVTIRPVYDEQGKEVWVWLGETEREHTCRDGMALREKWWERGARTGRLHH